MDLVKAGIKKFEKFNGVRGLGQRGGKNEPFSIITQYA